jgi:hypothetical protein
LATDAPEGVICSPDRTRKCTREDSIVLDPVTTPSWVSIVGNNVVATPTDDSHIGTWTVTIVRTVGESKNYHDITIIVEPDCNSSIIQLSFRKFKLPPENSLEYTVNDE